MESYQHFVAIVAGDNHQEMMFNYDKRKTVTPYVRYEFAKRKSYYDKTIKAYEELLKMEGEDKHQSILSLLDYYKSIDDVEFYLDLTEEFTLDEKTGDAMTTENPDGKFDGCGIGKAFSQPFILLDGSEAYSAKKKDVDWAKMHLTEPRTYEVVWDTVMDGKEPQDEDERIVYENMKNRTVYLNFFKTRENYIANMTSFWGYAYLDKDGWKEMEGDQCEWVTNFYDRFIAPLPDDTVLTIYECTRI